MMYRWDGGFIMVSGEKFDEGVEWYTKHLGWECLDRNVSYVGKKAFLKMPGAGVVTLKSLDSSAIVLKKDATQVGILFFYKNMITIKLEIQIKS